MASSNCQLCDQVYEPLLREHPGALAHYAMVSAVESPHDAEQMDLIRRGLADPSTGVGEPYRNRIRRINTRLAHGGLGGHTTRTLVVPGTRSSMGREDIALLHQVYDQTKAAGERVYVAWLEDQISRLLAACGSESPHVQAYLRGHEIGSPDGGYWALYEHPEMLTPVAVAEVVYRGGHFDGFDLYRQDRDEITPDRQRYVRFWHTVTRYLPHSVPL